MKKRVGILLVLLLFGVLVYAQTFNSGKVVLNEKSGSTGRLVSSENLNIGDIFYLDDGRKAKVTGVEDVAGENYNFDNLNFFANGVLVHNKLPLKIIVSPTVMPIKASTTTTYLVKLPDGYLLVDTGFCKSYEQFIKGITKNGVDPSEIRYILLTHHHGDHAGFAALLMEKYGTKIIVHEEALPWLAKGETCMAGCFINKRTKWIIGTISEVKEHFGGFNYLPVVPGTGDIIISGEVTDLSGLLGIKAKIICTPGHSSDSISLVFGDGRAYVGDAVVPIGKLWGTRDFPFVYEDKQKVLDSWEKLINEGAKTIYPAHGNPVSIEQLENYLQTYK